jgi:hypothetical protein
MVRGLWRKIGGRWMFLGVVMECEGFVDCGGGRQWL